MATTRAPQKRIDEIFQGLVLQDEAQERREVQAQQPPELRVGPAAAGRVGCAVVRRKKGDQPERSRCALLR